MDIAFEILSYDDRFLVRKGELVSRIQKKDIRYEIFKNIPPIIHESYDVTFSYSYVELIIDSFDFLDKSYIIYYDSGFIPYSLKNTVHCIQYLEAKVTDEDFEYYLDDLY